MRTPIATVLIILFSGCFPLELSVTPNGAIVIPRNEGVLVYNPAAKTGQLIPSAKGEVPAFAVASPDGTKVAWASTLLEENGKPGTQSRLLITDIKSGATEEVMIAKYAAFIQWAPNGLSISYSFISGENFEGVEESLPEIRVITIEEKSEKVVSRNTSAIHRWTPDGKGIVFLKTETKDTMGRSGSLVLYDVKSGRARKIAPMRDAEWFDLSPDGQEAVLSAKKDDEKSLFVVKVENGATQKIAYDAAFARYSPDGSHVVIHKEDALWIAGRDFALPEQSLVRAEPIEGMEGGKYHPVWYSKDEVLFLGKRATFGLIVFTRELMAANIHTNAVRNFQPGIESSLNN